MPTRAKLLPSASPLWPCLMALSIGNLCQGGYGYLFMLFPALPSWPLGWNLQGLGMVATHPPIAASFRLSVKYCPDGSAPWYCTSSGDTFGYNPHSKNQDVGSVGRDGTSRRYCPFPPSNSLFCRPGSYCFNTAATPPATAPPGLYLLPIAWLNHHGYVQAVFCLCVWSSCLLPLSYQDMRDHPAVFQLDFGIDFILPHPLISVGSVTDFPQRFALASASWSICPRYIYLSHVVLSCIFGLRAPECLRVVQGIGCVAGRSVG